MAGVKHNFSVAIADDASAQAAGQVLPSHWNEEHVLSGVAEQSALDVVSAAVDTVSAAVAALALSGLADVSIASPSDQQFLIYSSAEAQWVNSSIAAGAASVTSAEFADLASAVAANSAQMVSADNAISAAVAALSGQHTSLAGAVATNSAQMVSADNAISAAVVALSAQHTSLAASVAGALSAIGVNSANVTSVAGRLDAVSAQHTSLAASVAGALSAIGVNSANVTSIAGRLDAVSAQHTSLAASVAGALSAIGVNSANVTSVAGRLDGVSAQHTSLAASVAGALSAIGVNSAQMTSADNAISAAAAAVSVRVDSVNTQHVSLVSDVGRISSELGAVLTSSQGPLKRILAGNQTNAAIAPVSVSGFTFTCSAGVGYEFSFGMFTSVGASLAGNHWVLSAPSSSPIIAVYQQGGCVGGVSTVNVDRTNTSINCVSVSAVGVPIACYIRGTFRCSANGGTFALAHGNNTTASTATSTITIIAGSYGYVWRQV